ncbi:unnamed protein product [Gongylonema pulchrum]|uniref:ABC transporter n=1 Tax=Gongylonema pulchrum TaxID=637853 RepID=A0A183D3W1_9BILA|nr:unnamed protein product [Gongylonema pulchrum]
MLQILGVLTGAVCGLHLPAISLLFMFVFKAFESGDLLIHNLCLALAMYCGVGVIVFVSQFISVGRF